MHAAGSVGERESESLRPRPAGSRPMAARCQGASPVACVACMHGRLLLAAKEHMTLYVVRVATDDNIADLPSRGEFQVLEEQGAVYAEPRLEEPHLQPEYWQVLKERCCSE